MSASTDAGAVAVTIRVDGVELVTTAERTVMQALDEAGWLAGEPRVPSLCWHPSLGVGGSCRLCRVEVVHAGHEGEDASDDAHRAEGDPAAEAAGTALDDPDLAAACSLPVREGLEVRTDSERVRAARRTALELHLARHPAECPTCDRNGDCALQRHVFVHGPRATRVAAPGPDVEKQITLGPGLALDRTRCVHCEMCVRFCDEVTQTGELTFVGVGEERAVACAPGREVDNAYGQNLVEVCPVGAITRVDDRPIDRPWSVRSTPGVCGGCGRGCNVFVDTRGDRVVRLRPRRNDAVNRSWMCDAGRLGAGDAERPDRLRHASVRDEHGRLVDVTIDEAIEEAAGRIAEVVDAKGAGVLGGVASAHATNEDLFVFARLLSAIGTDHAAVAVPQGSGDALLVVPDKAANARGAEALGFAPPGALLDRLRGGGLDALVVMGHDLLDPAVLDEAGLEDTTPLDRLDTLIVIDTAPSALLRHAHVVIPALHRLEKRGTLTNVAGRVQRISPTRRPDFDARAEGEVVVALGRLLGLDGLEADWDVSRVSRAMSDSVPALAGRHLDAVGDAGLPSGETGASSVGGADEPSTADRGRGRKSTKRGDADGAGPAEGGR